MTLLLILVAGTERLAALLMPTHPLPCFIEHDGPPLSHSLIPLILADAFFATHSWQSFWLPIRV